MRNGGFAHSPRNAAVIGMRAARSAGSNPPTKPSANAHTMPSCSSCGVTRKPNATCAWAVLFNVDAL